MRLFWQAWLEFAHRAGAYQSVALLHALYFGVFGPSALVSRVLGGKLLDLDTRPRQSYWVVRQPTIKTIDGLTRQY